MIKKQIPNRMTGQDNNTLCLKNQTRYIFVITATNVVQYQ